MTSLSPQSPFIWPEPRVVEEMASYEQSPPYDALVLASQSLFGIVSGITESGIDAMRGWLECNPDLRVYLVAVVYPACATRERDFLQLLNLIEQTPNRLNVHVRALERVTDRAMNTLCFLSSDAEPVHFVIGPTEDFGLAPRQGGHANLVFRAEPGITEAFKRHFDWLWACTRELNSSGTVQIPALVLPEGTEMGAGLWRAYTEKCGDTMRYDDAERVVAFVNPDTGDVTLRSDDGAALESPTDVLGLKKLDPLADNIARLYARGVLVSVDKLSRIPPLDAPLAPSVFGDSAEMHKGNVVRKVSMRVSIIDEKTLKEIDKRRQGLRVLLTKFTYGLADNMRWMPRTARGLFEAELTRLNEEGQKLIADLLKGDVKGFVEGKRKSLTDEINAMFAELGRSGQVTNDVIEHVIQSMGDRLDRTRSGNFMPKLSYSQVGFVGAESTTASPWGQAYSLLADVAVFPRRALTDPFFFRGLKVAEEDLIEAMNVAGDALCRDMGTRGIKDRCKAELALLSRIEKAPLEPRDRCEMVFRLLDGYSIAAVDATLTKMESD